MAVEYVLDGSYALWYYCCDFITFWAVLHNSLPEVIQFQKSTHPSKHQGYFLMENQAIKSLFQHNKNTVVNRGNHLRLLLDGTTSHKVSLSPPSKSYKFLMIFPHDWQGHRIPFWPLAEALVMRGHEVIPHWGMVYDTCVVGWVFIGLMHYFTQRFVYMGPLRVPY